MLPKFIDPVEMITPMMMRPKRDLVGDHLRRGAQRAEERILRVRGPAAHDHAVDFQRGHGEDEEDGHVDVRKHPAIVERNDRPGDHREHEGGHGCQHEYRAVSTRRDHHFLDHVFQRVSHGLQQPEGADHVGASPHLHRGPDLAVAVDQKQQRNHHECHNRQHLRQDQDGDAAGSGKEISHRSSHRRYSCRLAVRHGRLQRRS